MSDTDETLDIPNNRPTKFYTPRGDEVKDPINAKIGGVTVGDWLDLQTQWSNPSDPVLDLMSEVGKLRAKVSFYEARIQTLNSFMLSNVEIKVPK
jgi:hypothetical protein